MHQVDYQLGLEAAEEYDNAAGAGALLVACNTKCTAAHPFSKSKRLACKGVCEQKYAVRQETGKTFGINKIIGAQASEEAAAAEQTALQQAEELKMASDLTSTQGSSGGGSDEKKAGLGTGAMIGIGVGVLVLVVGVVLIMRK